MVDVFADFLKVFVEVFTGATVAVPVGVIELHKAGAAFDEATGEEAVGGE